MKRWPVILALVMLLSTWGSLQLLSHGEPVPSKKPFADFPLTIEGRWTGKELGMDQSVLDILKLTDYMMRLYVPTTQTERALPVWLYVGYYQSQRTGSTYHSPKNCLPGAGWQFVESHHVVVPASPTASILINKVLIQKGLDRQVILYWYHDRGRIIASEYWAKGYMIWDAMTQNRTDGALVRISVPVTTTPEDAYQHGLKFLQDAWPLLIDFMPSGPTAAPV
ncbi:exosortase C-terminal domain/associated protein EpsI [Candidatus Nitrospira bockiana]